MPDSSDKLRGLHRTTGTEFAAPSSLLRLSLSSKHGVESFSKWLREQGIDVSATLLFEFFGPHKYAARYGRDGQRENDLREALSALRQSIRQGSEIEENLKTLRSIAPVRVPDIGASEIEKFEKQSGERVRSKSEHSASEGTIARGRATENFKDAAARSAGNLPSRPKLWNQDFRGKPAGERDRALIAHIEHVYGDYLPQHANEMREYLGRKDPKLLAAIKVFGFKNLPENLRMPSIRQKVMERIARAAAGEYPGMNPEEKKSVRTATQRRLSPKV